MAWFNLVNHDATNKKASFRISDQIGKDWWTGDGVVAKEFIDAVDSVGEVGEIDLFINSPGGDVYDGLEIYNYLNRHPATINVYIDGMAASIASVIAMAGDTINMPSNTEMMIHNPSTWAVGDAKEMRKTADRLDSVRDLLLEPYIAFTNKEGDEIAALMDAETYMTAEQAVELGFATKVEDKAQILNTFDLKDIKEKVQAQFKAQVKPEKKPKPKTENIKPQETENTAAQVIAMCHDKGLDYLANGFVTENLSIKQVENRLVQANEIQNLCASADITNVTQQLVQNMNNPVELLRIATAEVKAQLDQDIDTTQVDDISNKKPSINNRDIYANRRSL
ncbi:MAG: head maturation protease, ClpP-related [Cognaticolwellia aestuarii]